MTTFQQVPSTSSTVKLYEVTYQSGPYQVKGCLAKPVKHTATLPGLLYLRGGYKSFGMVSKEWVTTLAKEGYVVFAPYYRGNEGGEGSEDFIGEDREDAAAAFDVLAGHEGVDERRIHIMGFSRGGAMALFTAIARPQSSSVVVWSGVTDMRLTYEEREDLQKTFRKVTGGTPAQEPEEYERRTPIKYIEKLSVPLLIIHSRKDENVSINHAYLLQREMEKYENPCEAKIYNDFSHHLNDLDRKKVLQEACDWMKKWEENKRKDAL